MHIISHASKQDVLDVAVGGPMVARQHQHGV